MIKNLQNSKNKIIIKINNNKDIRLFYRNFHDYPEYYLKISNNINMGSKHTFIKNNKLLKYNFKIKIKNKST